MQGALALQLGQLTHTCEDVSVEATTILLGVEQTEGETGCGPILYRSIYLGL